MAPLFYTFTFISLLAIVSNSVFAEPQVPAMFVFGDSLLDPGNNNNLVTLAKANYYPYGIDFPEGVTGRYCNGGTTADHLSELLGLPLIPPFNNPNTTARNMLQGVNYASAAAGILNNTGRLFGNLFSMDSQIQNFEKTVQEIESIMKSETKNLIRKSLFYVSFGSNDYINNLLIPFSESSRKYNPETYTLLLVQEYRRQLQTLYDLGARKFLIGGVGPLGCIPNQIGNSRGKSDKCVESTNNLASQFNTKLKTMLQDLNTNLPESHFLYWDVYNMSMDIINNYSQYGFKYPLRACCGAGRDKGQILCLPILPMKCQNRSDFVFWDPYHPTDLFNSIASKAAYNGTLQNYFPINVEQLAQL
ncbi:hypothetical protein LUZ60_016813 [Juncus effusus]|nr:hypothetical protein LUZ60_016813 [Juncus effusus]